MLDEAINFNMHTLPADLRINVPTWAFESGSNGFLNWGTEVLTKELPLLNRVGIAEKQLGVV